MSARLTNFSKKWLSDPAIYPSVVVLTCAVAGLGSTVKRYKAMERATQDSSRGLPSQHPNAHHDLEQVDVLMMMR
ncbi:hypothetical protein Ae201684P_022053 [Aphanomyces euteiches]|uniref:Uncharacterized protein n=1 Tax=Aphanomyces euteiches TaxID=100861 RepID=A0A6G0W774_9STRA|nr:hypothetical protein Ae201684_018071 [Aphanomyces euteiches]KAH9072475.1 hypothetical protein Ae201684P_022053 [Aphanomyces euteiches]